MRRRVTVVAISLAVLVACSSGDKQAFAAIASLNAGRIAITWYAVPC